MSRKRVSEHDLEIGSTVPWDVHGENGELLVRKGHVVSSVKQLEVLIKRGLYSAHVEATPGDKPKPASVLRMLNAANRRLESLLTEISLGHDHGHMKDKLLEVAKVVAQAVDLQPDVAQACILHNQKVGHYAIRHCLDTAVIALLIARAMHKCPLESLAITAAALTMNVGMLAHQERLQSTQGILPPEDLDLIHHHPEKSVELLRHVGVDDHAWLACVLMHHENENGSGYPYRKFSHDIPLDAKIISLADRYCARISTRSYRKSLKPNAALREMLMEGKETINPTLGSIFIKELGIYPIGTFVRLENGEIGVVTGKGNSTTTPIVYSLVGPRGAPLDAVIRRDTSKPLSGVREVLNETQAAIGFNLDQLWGPVAAT